VFGGGVPAESTRPGRGGRQRRPRARPGAAGFEAGEFAGSGATVIGIAIVDDHFAKSFDRRGALVQLVMRARRPVEPGRPVVGAAERHRRRLEELNRLGVVAVLVRPPAGLPRRAIAVDAVGKPHQEIGEHVGGFAVFVGEDVGRRQVVERLLGERVGRVGVGVALDQRGVLVAAAEFTQRAQIEELRLSQTRAALVDDRPQRVVGRGVFAQMEVALREPQIDERPIVAGRERANRLEGLARLAEAPAAVQHLGTAEIELVGLFGRPELRPIQRRHRRRRLDRFGRERVLVVHLAEHRRRQRRVADVTGGAAEAQVRLRRARRFHRRELLQHLGRVGPVFVDLVDVGGEPQGGLAQVAGRRLVEQLFDGGRRGVELLLLHLRAPEIQQCIAADDRIADRPGEHRRRLRVVAGLEVGDRAPERRRRRRRGAGGHEPVVGHRARLRCGGRCARTGRRDSHQRRGRRRDDGDPQ
jgi:hypothetical protein